MKTAIHWNALAFFSLVALTACGKELPTSPETPQEPAQAGTPSAPAKLPLYDVAAKKGFIEANLAPNTNGYPDCENPTQLDFGYTKVPGCAVPVGEQLPMQSHCHMKDTTPVTWYGSNPPASGDHWPSPSRDLGVNTNAIPREAYVHSMEHGAVIFAYNCPEGCAAKLATMAQVVQSRGDRKFKVLMTPDARMKPNTFAAISWTWLYMFDEPNVQQLTCFIDQHYNHARENDKAL